MDTATAAYMARGLMRDYGLGDWTFRFDRAKKRFGMCNYRTRTITLSEPLVKLNSVERVRNTLLHEIAHALTPGHGHDYVWRMKARTIGCDGRRCYEAEEVVRPPAAWSGTCPSCGNRTERHRMTDKARSRTACKPCCVKYGGGRFDARFLFVWRRVRIAA